MTGVQRCSLWLPSNFNVKFNRSRLPTEPFWYGQRERVGNQLCYVQQAATVGDDDVFLKFVTD
eukprot:scaffold48391_cov38-Cyclotella_meneghiniana.AAC.1